MLEQSGIEAVLAEWLKKDPKCPLCQHRAARDVCDSDSSPRAGSRVAPDDACAEYVMSPGCALRTEGLHARLQDDDERAAGLLTAALQHPLPLDTRAVTMLFLSSWQPTDSLDALSSPHAAATIDLADNALTIELENHFGVFDSPTTLGLFRHADLVHAYRCAELVELKRYAEATDYLRPVLERHDALTLNPLVRCMQSHILDLAVEVKAFGRASDRQSAEHYFSRLQQALAAGVRQSETEEVVEDARRSISIMSEDKTEKSGGCFVATAVYGADAPELMRLRFYRDERLLRSVTGRVLVTLYYRCGPGLASIVSRHIRLQRAVRAALDRIVRHLPTEARVRR